MKKPWYKTWWVWVIIVFVLIIIGAISSGGKDDNKDLSSASSTTKNSGGSENVTVTGNIMSTNEPTDKPTPEPTVAPIVYEAEFGSGNYTVGVDFPAGIYDIEAVSGGGNVSSSNLYEGGINAVMGTEDMNETTDIYEQKYSNIKLPKGTVLFISGVVIRIKSGEASGEPLVPRNQVITETVTLDNGNFVAGKDFPAGVYNVIAMNGNGNVSSDNLYSGGINAIMGVRDDAMYEKEYKNIEFPDGVMLSVDGVTIQLVPST